MITKLVYNNKAFNILNEYGFKSSNNEVTFNDITIDFTNKSIEDIPYKYQEIQIKQAESENDILNGKVLFIGFLDDINLSDMKLENEEREMTLTLLSPLKMATKRSVSLIGTYKLKEAIRRILQPLIDDGFSLKEINVPDGQITTNFVLETVEYCMNNIGFKRNIFWNINELKEISVNSINYLFGLPVAKTISKNNNEKGLLKIQPKIENIDYANVLNFKNVRLIHSYKEFDYPIIKDEKIIKKGDIVTFDYPIIIDEKTLRDYINEQSNYESNYYSFELIIQIHKESDPTYSEAFELGINMFSSSENYNKFYKYGDITFSNDSGEEGKVVLQRDSFFSNLITGFKWNGEDNSKILFLRSDTMLRYTTMRFMYSAEINKLKNIISKSGQIENTIDYQQKWTTLPQLIEYARSLMNQNSNVVNEVLLEYDINPNLKVGDIIEINEPTFYIQGKFAVKDIDYAFYNENDEIWKITLKSTDLISTYIDMFRPDEKEENEDNINTVILSEFVEEQIRETHSVDIENQEHTLNFII